MLVSRVSDYRPLWFIWSCWCFWGLRPESIRFCHSHLCRSAWLCPSANYPEQTKHQLGPITWATFNSPCVCFSTPNRIANMLLFIASNHRCSIWIHNWLHLDEFLERRVKSKPIVVLWADNWATDRALVVIEEGFFDALEAKQVGALCNCWFDEFGYADRAGDIFTVIGYKIDKI